MDTVKNLPQLRIGILGLGTVGQSTYNLLLEHKDRLAKIIGAEPLVIAASVRDLKKPRDRSPVNLTNESFGLVERDDIDLIVETIGGITPAHELVRKALKSGKGVVTANKELIAKHGEELMQLAIQNEVPLMFEAAVGGGIPIVKALHLQLQGNHISRIDGIFNGTTNFILSKMKNEALSYDEALHQAQIAGFAEADPMNDVEGFDTAYKIAILGWLSHRKAISLDEIEREGITQVSLLDMKLVDNLDSFIKLIGVFELRSNNQYGCRVRPMVVPNHHPYATVDNEFNAVTAYGDFVGSVTMFGKGAGGDPTASSIVGDIIASQLLNSKITWSSEEDGEKPSKWEIDKEWLGQYFVRFPDDMRSIVRQKLGRNSIEIVQATKSIEGCSAFVTSPITERLLHEALDRLPSNYQPTLIKWLPLI